MNYFYFIDTFEYKVQIICSIWSSMSRDIHTEDNLGRKVE